MQFILDMNLEPAWCPALQAQGWECQHWREVGDPKALDPVILEWATSHDRIVLTHDLDFGTLLAVGQRTGPSVVLLRVEDVRVVSLEAMLLPLLRMHLASLEQGALMVVGPSRSRVRLLPLRRTP